MARKTHKSPEAARKVILNAAEKVMTEVGPAGLRISTVAKEAKMAHPNIIHHFGSREGLINAVSDRVGDRATERVTAAIKKAVVASDDKKIEALTQVLDTAFPGDEGKLAVWLHLSGADEGALNSHMQRIGAMSHELRRSIDPNADPDDTNRLVVLITLALVGEVVSGAGIKDALGFTAGKNSQVEFREWLASIVLSLNDDMLQGK